MKQVVQVFGILNLVAFVALAIVTIRQWRARRDRAALWAALCFGALGAVVLLGRVVPDHPHELAAKIVQRADIALFVVFPYLLFRFTLVFRRSKGRVGTVVGAMTIVLVLWTFALPRIPAAGESRPTWFWAYLIAFLVHWTALSVVVAWRLWSAGRRQPTVARRRMQMLALASASLTVALLLVVATTDADSPAAAISGVVGFVSALAFLLGLAPPGIARLLWRRPEQQRLQAATAELLTLAMTEREVAARVLRPAAEIVGARAAAVLDADGRVVVAHGLDDDVCRQMSDGAGPPQVWHDAEPVRVDYHGGAIVVWTTPFAPFFGTEELRALRSLGAFLSIAMDRVRLFAQEHETRIALERANELQANFVALAAHELRTPVTTIHGFVHTINRLGERIDVDQKAEIMETLEQQTERMAKLVEQLLDLSRLEAEAIQITPEPVDVSTRLNELATLAAGARSGDVEVDAPRDLVAAVDSSAFERVISNLITNALRYGAPPVIVRAKQTDNHFRVSVEDRGPGVSADFVPNLFERFSRSESSRARAGGTGLGLAIARAYARAHGGDLFYEPVRPHGARFELVVPRRAPSV